MKRWTPAAAGALSLVAATQASALELSGGVGAGGMLAGSRPRFAVSPHAGVSWRTDGGFLFAVHDALTLLPAINKYGIGVHNQISIAIGYAWKGVRFVLGPAFSAYSMPACGGEWCARQSGLSPGGRARLDLYFAGPLGISIGGSVDWLSGTAVLPGGVAASAVAGPVLKWGDQ